MARVAFNRPEVLNAIDVPTAQAFLATVRRVTAEPGLRSVVLAGEGGAFVAGGDVARFADDFANSSAVVVQLLDALHPAILALRATPAPVIAAVRGAAAGAGLSLVLAADYVIAAADARFLIAYDKVGASPDCGGTWFLPRRIGRSKAFELMLLGTAIDAETAHAYGLANDVAPAGEVETRAREIAGRIASGPTKAFGAFKALIDNDMPLAQHLEAERAAFIAATGTADFREGVSAFVEKRKPTFSGR